MTLARRVSTVDAWKRAGSAPLRLRPLPERVLSLLPRFLIVHRCCSLTPRARLWREDYKPQSLKHACSPTPSQPSGSTRSPKPFQDVGSLFLCRNLVADRLTLPTARLAATRWGEEFLRHPRTVHEPQSCLTHIPALRQHQCLCPC